MNTVAQASVCVPAFTYFRCMPRRGIAGASLGLVFRGTQFRNTVLVARREP